LRCQGLLKIAAAVDIAFNCCLTQYAAAQCPHDMKRRVLLCALDWGLGHATRCLPVAEALRKNNLDVVLASSGNALALLRRELHGYSIHELPGYDVDYDSRSFEWGIIRQSRKIWKAISSEHTATDEIVGKDNIDIIISDNRFGCYHQNTRNIFLSHHLNIRTSGLWRMLGPVVNAWHRRLIRRFDEVWIPDYPDHRLSGELSRGDFNNAKFVGALSSMRKADKVNERRYDVIAVLSGPEPQRTRFGEIVFDQLLKTGKRFVVVEGKPDTFENSDHRVAFMSRNDLNEAIAGSEIVISRSGYSTIMDLSATGGKAIFVPTPGQTEQIYLAGLMHDRRIAFYQTQDNFDLALALDKCNNFTGFTGNDQPNELLANAIQNLMGNGKVD
jgi:hypothetical protein